MSAATYTCGNCGGTFENEEGWSEEHAKAEFNALFPTQELTQAVVLCDVCWEACMAWAREKGMLE